jgi:hypothetical protein
MRFFVDAKRNFLGMFSVLLKNYIAEAETRKMRQLRKKYKDIFSALSYRQDDQKKVFD